MNRLIHIQQMGLRFGLIVFAVIFASGFRLAQSSLGEAMRWDISKQSPVLWISVCEDMRQLEVDNLYLPETDPLYPYWFDSIDLIQSVMSDFNDIPDSFVQLRWEGDEFLASDATPTQPYDAQQALFKTISVCTGQKNPALAGHASAQSNAELCKDKSFADQFPQHCSKRVAARCEVVLSESYIRQSAAHFVHALTHELGHCLGLMHNQATTQSVMSYAADRSSTTRLTLDDKMALVFLYPENESSADATINFGLTQCSAAK